MAKEKLSNCQTWGLCVQLFGFQLNWSSTNTPIRRYIPTSKRTRTTHEVCHTPDEPDHYNTPWEGIVANAIPTANLMSSATISGPAVTVIRAVALVLGDHVLNAAV